jgi:hypothetical protein
MDEHLGWKGTNTPAFPVGVGLITSVFQPLFSHQRKSRSSGASAGPATDLRSSSRTSILIFLFPDNMYGDLFKWEQGIFGCDSPVPQLKGVIHRNRLPVLERLQYTPRQFRSERHATPSYLADRSFRFRI